MTIFDFPPETGPELKDAALELLEVTRDELITEARHALLARLMTDGTATIDDVRAAVECPANINPKFFGAVPGVLAKAGIIRNRGFAKTTRKKGHARPVIVWELSDRAGAAAWITSNPLARSKPR